MVRSIKHTFKRARFFRANICRCRITYITPVVKQFGLNPLCFYGRIPTRSLYWLRRRAMIVSSILLACTTSEIPLKLPHSVRSFALLSTMIMAYFHCCGTSPLPIQTIISSNLRHRLRLPLTVILNSSAEPPDPSFPDEFNVFKEYYMSTFSYLTYTKLRSRFPSRSIVFRCLHVAF